MTPTDNRHSRDRHPGKRPSHDRYPDDNYPQSAEADDARLQPDPELALSEGRASRAQIFMVTLGALIVLSLVMYGITQPHNERGGQQAAAPAPAATTGSAPSAEPQAPQEQQTQPNDHQPQQPAKQGPSDSARPQ
jgi:hypothetical protein